MPQPTAGIAEAALAAIAAAAAAGLLTTFALRRAFKVKPAPRASRGAHGRPGEGRRRLVGLVTSILPASQRAAEEGRDSLARSGVAISPAAFWAVRIGAAAAGLLAGALLGAAVGGARGLALAALMLAIGIASPQLWLMGRRSAWREEIERQLPAALDLMAICVSAGGSFDSALRAVGERMDGAIAQGFMQVAEESTYSSRSQALLRFADRAQVQSLTVFVASLVQAERSGGAVVDILRTQAESVRKARRLKVEERANQLSAKMLLPMIAFCFPVLIVVMLAPVVSMIIEALF